MQEAKTTWVKMKPLELEKIVIDLHNQKLSPAKIGLVLRDEHGVPKSKLISKKISQIIKEKGGNPLQEADVLKEKITSLDKHISQNKHDYTSKRSLIKTIWAMKKIEQISKKKRENLSLTS